MNSTGCDAQTSGSLAQRECDLIVADKLELLLLVPLLLVVLLLLVVVVLLLQPVLVVVWQ